MKWILVGFLIRTTSGHRKLRSSRYLRECQKNSARLDYKSHGEDVRRQRKNIRAPQWGPLGSKGSWASPLSDCPSFSLILDESMVEEAGDGWPVKPHSVGQPAPWNPSSPSLVDGSLYTSSRLLMHHYDMCPQDRQYYFDQTAVDSTQPCQRAMHRYLLSQSETLLGRKPQRSSLTRILHVCSHRFSETSFVILKKTQVT